MKLKTIVIVAATLLNIVRVDAAEQAPRPATRQSAPKKLDLTPPSLLRIATAEQINQVLSRAVDPQLERIEVEAPRLNDLPFVDRSNSPVQTVFDTVVHWLGPSTQYASRVNYALDSDSYRPVPLAMSSYHPNFPPPYAQR